MTITSKDTGCLTAVPANDNVPAELLALGAAIGKVPDWKAIGQEAIARFPKVHAHLAAAEASVAGSDKLRPILLGITGKRNVGKSTVATLLEERYGFARAHAFDGGKTAAVTYFGYITGDYDVAHRMVYGDLKDKPSTHLPGGVAPRFFLEKFGHFMGVTMGVEWTLAMEIARIRKLTPNAPIVVESLVYEAPWFKAQGGFVLRLERPDFDGPAGIESDSVQAGVEANYTISAPSVSVLEREAYWLADKLMAGEAIERLKVAA